MRPEITNEPCTCDGAVAKEEREHAEFAICPTREDAERVAEMLREVGRRLKP